MVYAYTLRLSNAKTFSSISAVCAKASLVSVSSSSFAPSNSDTYSAQSASGDRGLPLGRLGFGRYDAALIKGGTTCGRNGLKSGPKDVHKLAHAAWSAITAKSIRSGPTFEEMGSAGIVARCHLILNGNKKCRNFWCIVRERLLVSWCHNSSRTEGLPPCLCQDLLMSMVPLHRISPVTVAHSMARPTSFRCSSSAGAARTDIARSIVSPKSINNQSPKDSSRRTIVWHICLGSS